MDKFKAKRIDGVLYPLTKASLVEDCHVLTDTATGRKYELVVTNGTLHLVAERRILNIGNSITIHPVVEDLWWGIWGMAASERDKDYVHLLGESLGCESHAINVAEDFERGTTTDLGTLIEESLGTPGVVITPGDYTDYVIKIGENVTNTSTLSARLQALIASIKTYNPAANVVLCTTFWAEAAKDQEIRAAGLAAGVPVVELGSLNNRYNKWEVGDEVYGDDGQLHTITNSGVANHPSDTGMQNIASLILNTLRNE